MAKKPKTVRIPITDINQLTFSTVDKTGATVTMRAGKIAFVMSQHDGCKIFSDNGLFVESKDNAAAVNQTISEIYTVAARGYYEAVVAEAQPVQDNRKARRAAASGKRK